MRGLPDGRWRCIFSRAIDARVGIWAFLVGACESATGFAEWYLGGNGRDSTQAVAPAPILIDEYQHHNQHSSSPVAAQAPPDMTIPRAPDDDTDRVEHLAVAVELKFLLPLLVKGKADPDAADNRPPQVIPAKLRNDAEACQRLAYRSIADTIQEAGPKSTTIHAIADGGLTERHFWETHWIVKKANSAEPGPTDDTEAYVWVGVEISSPKFPVCESHTHRQMDHVLRALMARHRLVANYTCEVHVHLGRRDGERFRLSALKRLASFLWAAEPVLRSIRDPNSPNYDNVYTWGSELRRFSRLAQAIDASEDGHRQSLMLKEKNRPCINVKQKSENSISLRGIMPDPQVLAALPPLEQRASRVDEQAIGAICKAPTHTELGRLLSGPSKQYRRLGFNFSAFGLEDERAERSPRTVEFRMMEGTVRPDLILNWVAICARVVIVAVVPDGGKFHDALWKALGTTAAGHQEGDAEVALTDEDGTLGCRKGREFSGLMQALGLPRDVYAGFEEKVIREH